MVNGQPLEDKIADRITRSSLSIKVKDPVNGPDQGVYVDNPYDAINPNRITRLGKHPKAIDPDPVYRSDILLPEVTRTQLIGRGLFDKPNSYEVRINLYLGWGADHAEGNPSLESATIHLGSAPFAGTQLPH